MNANPSAALGKREGRQFQPLEFKNELRILQPLRGHVPQDATRNGRDVHAQQLQFEKFGRGFLEIVPEQRQKTTNGRNHKKKDPK